MLLDEHSGANLGWEHDDEAHYWIVRSEMPCVLYQRRTCFDSGWRWQTEVASLNMRSARKLSGHWFYIMRARASRPHYMLRLRRRFRRCLLFSLFLSRWRQFSAFYHTHWDISTINTIEWLALVTMLRVDARGKPRLRLLSLCAPIRVGIFLRRGRADAHTIIAHIMR